jgi:hypothetical protein
MSEKEMGEGYSREAYDDAERKVKEANAEISPEKSTDELKAAVEQRAGAEERRGQLHEMAWDEALEKNKKYDELYAQKEQIDQEIATFRRDELGMAEVREEAKPERTRETEIKSITKFWQELGYEVDESDIQAEIEALPETEKMTRFEFLPKGIKMSEAFQKMSERYPTWSYTKELDKIKMPRETTESYAISYRDSQEPDEDSLGENAKSALTWEETDEKFMSPLELTVAEMRWHAENGTHLNEKNWTMCPGSRDADGFVPFLDFGPLNGEVDLCDANPGYRSPYLGVRRVVSKES